MFRVGNHTFDELLQGTAIDIASKGILWTANQFRTASVEISADNTDITDKNGNVVMTRYNAKSGTFNSTHAFFHPAIANAQSGSDIQVASESNLIVMPRMATIAAGGSLDVSDAIDGTIKVIGLYGNGANGDVLTQGTTASLAEKTFALVTDEDVKTLTVPAAATDAPIEYHIIYDRQKDSGYVLTNSANTYPKTVEFDLLVSYVDICTKETKPAIIQLPSFTPDPNMTLTFDREEQDVDFNGTLCYNS